MQSTLDTITQEEHSYITKMINLNKITNTDDAVKWVQSSRTGVNRIMIINELKNEIEKSSNGIKPSRLNKNLNKYRKELIREMKNEFKVFHCRIYPSVMKNVIKKTFNAYRRNSV